jgi:peptidoglycan/xylan/chitin deacetylase (PgdA/CDA1 family)
VQHRFINLTFHGIGAPSRSLEPGEESVWVGTERFAAVLDAVRGRDDVRVTFDDGNRSDLEIALPALRERGLTATFFVVAGRLGAPEFLSADDVRTLAAAGMKIGSHGMHHRPWREADLEEEVGGAKALLEAAAGRPVDEAACPFGSYDRRVLSALKRAGFARVYTSDRGAADPGAWLQARTSITERDALEPILSAGPAPLSKRAKLAVKRWR